MSTRQDSNQSGYKLRDVNWILGNPKSQVLVWTREWIQELVPRLTGADAALGSNAGDTMNIVVGNLDENLLVAEAVSQGVIDLDELNEDDFVLKQVRMNDKVFLFVAGRNPRSAAYAVSELFERLGCTFLISGDRLPPCDPDQCVPELDEVRRTDASWRGILFGGYCFVANSMFSLPDYEAMFDQMVKLKMNRIIFYHFSNEPFIDYTFKGERKLVGDISHPDSGYISYGREFTGSWRVEDLPVHQETFDREKMCPHELQDVTTSDQALDQARSLMQAVMAAARKRGIEPWMSFLPQFTSPNLSKYLRPMPRTHGHWSAHISCTDPEVGPLNRTRIQGIVDAYPDLEGVLLSIPEGFFEDPYPETEALIDQEWGSYAEALDLQNQYWGKFWPGEEQQKAHIRADIAFTEIVKKTINEARAVAPDLKLGICTVCKAYLLTHLHEILPKDMPFVDIESRALWTLDGAPLHLFKRMKGRECSIVPRAVDDGSLVGMQFPLWQYSADGFLASAEENGTSGLMIQTTHIRGNEHSFRYLAGGMWGGPSDPDAFYSNYTQRIFGKQAAPAIQKALRMLEANDAFMGGRGQRNMPWNMVPPQILAMKAFRSFDRRFYECPLKQGLSTFEGFAEKYNAAIKTMDRAISVLASAESDVTGTAQSDLAYILARTRGFRDHLKALSDLTVLYRCWHDLFNKHSGDVAKLRIGLAALVGDAGRLEEQTRTSARWFVEAVSHTTDLAVLWMISHKMVLSSQCLRAYLENIRAFYNGREYWKPVPWDKLFGSLVYPTFDIEESVPTPAADEEPG